MKNYRIYFMGGKSRDITAEQAAGFYRATKTATSSILINGEVFMGHQVCSIEKIKGQELKDLCEIAGIEKKDVPKIEDYLQNNKLLNGR